MYKQIVVFSLSICTLIIYADSKFHMLAYWLAIFLLDFGCCMKYWKVKFTWGN